jgi:hypothetical protein
MAAIGIHSLIGRNQDNRGVGLRLHYFLLFAASVFVALCAPGVSAQPANDSASAPVPAQIAASRKVFISNAGVDAAVQTVFKRVGDPDEAYNHFYSAMAKWNRYELVTAPADADLVFEVGFTAPMYMNGSLPVYEPQFGLKIIDAKSHVLLWALVEPVKGAFREATWQKNFEVGLDALMGDLRKLSASPVVSSPSPAPAKNSR